MQENLQGLTQEVDINDVFEEILFCEENVIVESYKKGFAVGSSEDNIEGYHIGYHRGAEIGSELGYYLAFVEYYLHETRKSELAEKVLRNLESLKQGIDDFPTINTEDIDLLELIENYRVLFKKVCTQLKVKFDFKKKEINF